MAPSPEQVILHASAVASGGAAVLITGASGAGKSALALTLMAHGATLVADDRVIVTRSGDRVLASAPAPILGQIEARGVGILKAEVVQDSPIRLVVTMDEMETDRLPPRRSTNLLGIKLRMLHNVDRSYFAPAILQYLKGGEVAT